MNVNQKIFIGVFAVLVWVLALIVHHQWADIDMVAMITLCQAVLVGLGVTHLTANADAEPIPSTQPAQIGVSITGEKIAAP